MSEPFLYSNVMNHIDPTKYLRALSNESLERKLEEEFSSFSDLQLQIAAHQIFVEFQARAMAGKSNNGVEDTDYDLAQLGRSIMFEQIRRSRERDLK